MSALYPTSQRGAALLIVLATLVLVVSSSVTLLRLASTAKATREAAKRALMGDDLIRVANAPIVNWLASKSSIVVLAPETTIPEIDVLHDTWVTGDTRHELRITAWDQCGMVPFDVARSGSPLRLALPGEIRRAIDQVVLPRGEPPGLDFFSILAQPGIAVFPEGARQEPLLFGQAKSETIPVGIALGEDDYRAAIGAHVATHNPGRINVNTAPIELVEQALRFAGRGGLEQIAASRSEARLASLGDLPRVADPARSAPQIAASSNAWAFRIDISVGSLRRSWWAVYENAGSTWRCVQRLAILE